MGAEYNLGAFEDRDPRTHVCWEGDVYQGRDGLLYDRVCGREVDPLDIWGD